MPFTQWQAGQKITAGRLAAITPKWVDWTPTWVTSTGSATPSFGNATLACQYCQSGDLVVAKFEVVFGSTTNFGGGGTGDNWRFGLPIAASDLHQAIGFVELNKSTGVRAVARMRCTTTTAFELEVSSGRPDATAIANGGLADALSPWTWASGDAIRGVAQYEAA